MSDEQQTIQTAGAATLTELAAKVRYSLTDTLTPDPTATADGVDHDPRQIYSGHYVPVAPTPIADPVLIAHSHALFRDLGLADDLANDPSFQRMFAGDLSDTPTPIKPVGWATGYALSIYGTEYTQQCPFRTGNAYGDGRAISLCEIEHDGQRWELQLKGGGPTPYCRGADGRAVLRSSVREFLAQELMHALGIPTSRSLTLLTSTSETVMRPWYSEGSETFEPDILKRNPVAITTRVASSFLRVGQIELFARRARVDAHPQAMAELKQIVAFAIDREYSDDIDQSLPFVDQVVALATEFRYRLTALVANWMRVGYCQGNFNSDNCAVGGFTLDYGPFGFCEAFNPRFQPWTGGGEHFSFFNQPNAAAANYEMFWSALSHLVPDDHPARAEFDGLRDGFADVMHQQLNQVWTAKLGLTEFDYALTKTLFQLMQRSEADYTILFRELSRLPDEAEPLFESFASEPDAELAKQWQTWLRDWRDTVTAQHGGSLDGVGERMQQTNPKYTWREWLVAPAYQAAEHGDYTRIHELQAVMNAPYAEQGATVDATHYQKRPAAVAKLGGICHYSCSS